MPGLVNPGIMRGVNVGDEADFSAVDIDTLFNIT